MVVASPPSAPIRRPRRRRPADVVAQYAHDVVSGRVVAGPLVRRAGARHLRDLEHGAERGLRFDPEAADHALEFFTYLRLAEGEFADQPFTLHPSQVFIVGSLFGWVRSDDGFRRFRTAYVEEAKGNGKTPLCAGLGLYGLAADDEPAAQVYAAAVTREQAGILFSDATAMASRSPELRRLLTITAHNIGYEAHGSYFRPVSSEGRSLDAKRVHMALIDEVHEHRTPVVVNKMRAGTKGRRQALVVEITNSGYDRASVCWEHHEYSRAVLEETIENDSWFAYVCSLDEGDDPFTDETCWPKVNPLLGVSVTPRYLREQVAEAQGLPTKRAIVSRLNFCIWTQGETRWLDADVFADAADAPGPIPSTTEVWGGLDLASTTDLTALFLLAPRKECPVEGHAGRCFDVRCRFWVPQDGIELRSRRDHVPYDAWADEGWITATPGNVTDYDRIRADLAELADSLVFRSIGFDRWNATQLVTQLGGDGFDMLPVGQGYASLSGPAKLLEAHVAGRFIHHDGNPVLRWMVANAVAEMDPAGNVKPSKAKSTERIDGVAAWCDALFAWMGSDTDGFVSVYETRGLATIGMKR